MTTASAPQPPRRCPVGTPVQQANAHEQIGIVLTVGWCEQLEAWEHPDLLSNRA